MTYLDILGEVEGKDQGVGLKQVDALRVFVVVSAGKEVERYEDRLSTGMRVAVE